MRLTILEKQTTQGLETPGTAGDLKGENRSRRRSYMASPSSSSSSPRLRPRCTCSNQPGSAPCSKHGYMVPRQNTKRYGGAAYRYSAPSITPTQVGCGTPKQDESLSRWGFAQLMKSNSPATMEEFRGKRFYPKNHLSIILEHSCSSRATRAVNS
ncbi:hypothetical protein GOBAR_DD04641 [Gossypium barbadense]|nr:hypothetical protein GOBAR_DD04641 [Gossypium barbadense]